MINKLTDYAHSKGIDIVDADMPTDKVKGLYADDLIIISKDLTESEYTEILAEEVGHYETSHGNLLDPNDVNAEKQELRARQWAYERLVPLEKIIAAYEAHVSGQEELAAFLNVSEPFLEAAIARYHEKHGTYVRLQSYIIYFEPLGVMKIL
ncbi:ImmA/IrrE family metallo-endopeptidase [Fusibacter paucivorans]|uniref:ImmA/IrrE family metallo-endopeptidase n=1 Tax=Fusibacter paucivorans TaxID=76009 RepID=A0ABS5PTY7_9FIRM|nr:ImmA/IrrE family metallo-endopeptidase [Fusibacter paucivorans]MBS7527854.1 ImmA/IrrE family metallo-endopeptidase [Fusibacter paucivorans]